MDMHPLLQIHMRQILRDMRISPACKLAAIFAEPSDITASSQPDGNSGVESTGPGIFNAKSQAGRLGPRSSSSVRAQGKAVAPAAPIGKLNVRWWQLWVG